MNFYKNEHGIIFAYESDDEMQKFNSVELTPITNDEMWNLTAPPSKTLEQIRAEVEHMRRIAYANPITGSDPLYVEAYRMERKGEAGWQDVETKADARFAEIQAEYPWPEEPTP